MTERKVRHRRLTPVPDRSDTHDAPRGHDGDCPSDADGLHFVGCGCRVTRHLDAA